MKKSITTLLTIIALLSFSHAHCGSCEKAPKKSNTSIGKPAPEFLLTTSDGAEVSLAKLKGKVVVLEWVNFQCPFVKKHYDKGHMQALQKDFTDKGVIWVLISSANESHPTFLDRKALEDAAKERKSNASYALVDASGNVGRLYNAKTTPNMYIINKEGILVYSGAIDSKNSTNTADIEDSTNYVTEALNAMLANKEVKQNETKPYGCSVKY